MCDYEKNPKCAICSTSSLLRCAKCKTVFYCSTNHQHLDWPKHRKECRILARQQQQQQQHQQLQQQQQNNQNFNNNMMMMNVLSDVTTNISQHQQHQQNQQHQQLQQQQQQYHQLQQQQLQQIENVDADIGNDDGDSGGGGGVGNGIINDFQHISNNQILNNVEIESISTPSTQLIYSYPNPNPNNVINDNKNYIRNNQQSTFSNNSCKIGENVFSSEQRYEELCRNIINDMNNYGLSVVDDFLGMEKGLQILNEVHKMYAAGVFQDGQLASHSSNGDADLRTIRGDKIKWVKGTENGCANIGYLINQIDAVVCLANKMHGNGILRKYDIKERTKAMVACYPGSGSHYVMHVDNPNKDGRVITAIYYLNLNWDTKRSGGILRIFPENGESVADIEPKFDRIIFFWSDRRNPHEVQPAHRTRYAITVWYFDANERLLALNRCKQYDNNDSCL